MKWRSWIVGLVLAASCAGPEPPDAWSVERVAMEDDVVGESLCRDVTEFALGSHAAESDLRLVLEELARIGALAGATEALPTISEIEATLTDESLSDHQRTVQLHDLLVDAAVSLDDTTAAACEVPVFSATYAASGFGACHLELDIPIAAYTPAGVPGTCTADGGPSHLPCWSNDGNHLAVDCVSGAIVQAVGDAWREAGEPREISIDRTDPDAPPPPTVVTASGAPECAALRSLFLTPPAPNGVVPDFDRLVAAAADLEPDVRSLVDGFIDAAVIPPSLTEFEALVTSLDEATVAACGLPLASAWASLSATVAELPCWSATDLAYPAYEPVDCADGA